MKKKKTRKEFDNMAMALASYIKSMGGSAIVVGSVFVGKHYNSPKFNYFVQIDITGKMPHKKLSLTSYC